MITMRRSVLSLLLPVGVVVAFCFLTARVAYGGEETIKCPKCGFLNPAKTPDGKDMAQCEKCGYSLKSFVADKGPAEIDVSKYPADMQAGYATLEKRCSKCHTPARPLWTRFTDDEWEKYVKRMRRKPGSGIKADEAKAIYAFLVYDSKARAKDKDEYWSKVGAEDRDREAAERAKREEK